MSMAHLLLLLPAPVTPIQLLHLVARLQVYFNSQAGAYWDVNMRGNASEWGGTSRGEGGCLGPPRCPQQCPLRPP